jgi:DNA-binding IclR family transcriptional regulator
VKNKQKETDSVDESIQNYLAEHPEGSRTPDVARAIDRDTSTTRYRLMTLQLMGRITSTKQRGTVKYFLETED